MMMKSILAAGVSLLALSAVTTAQAKTVGHVSGGVTYVDNDIFSGKGINQYSFDFEGAAGFDLTPTWNVQFDTHFKSDRLSGGGIFGGKTLAIDTWRAGTQIFWRDSSQGMFGVELAYNTLDTGFGGGALDGFLAGLKGEYYGSDQYTIGGGVTYNTFEGKGSLDTFGGNLFVTYYVNEKTGISLTGDYDDTDVGGSSSNLTQWTVAGDVEYLFENNLSLSGVVSYGNTDISSNDFDTITVGAKLKVYFGTEGSLANQHRTGTLEAPLPSQFPFFGL